MAKLSLFYCTFLLVTTCAEAWDPFGIFGSARKAIEAAGENLIGNAKTAFEESMQNVFDDEITPLVNKVNAMALEDINVLKKDVLEVVANATHEIEGMIDHAAEVAQKLIDKSVEEIKRNIIDETADRIKDVEDNFFAGLGDFLQKVYEVVQNINCMVQGDIDKVYEDIYKLLGKGCGGFFPDKCCRQGGVAGKALTQMGDTQLYDLEICRRTSEIIVNTSVVEMEKAYVDCQIAAKKFYCTNFGVATAKDYFTREYNKWGTKYDFWSHPGESSRAGPVAVSVALRDDPCGTPVECYQQAIAKLNEARDEIKNKADMADVQSNMAVVQSEFEKANANLTTAQQQFVAQINDAKGDIAQNQDAIARNHNDIAQNRNGIEQNLDHITSLMKSGYIIGGGYQWHNDMVRCHNVNQITGGCTCPDGFTGYGLVTSMDVPNGGQDLTFLCYSELRASVSNRETQQPTDLPIVV